MATARPYKQDLPPKGGYEKIQFKRIPVKPLGSGMVISYKGIAVIFERKNCSKLNQNQKFNYESL